MLVSRNSSSSSSVSLTASRPAATSGSFARVSGEDALVREDQRRRVVDRGGDLAKADGDQPDLAVVLGDVSGGEDPRQVGPGGGVDPDVPLVELQAPVLHRGQVRDEAERGYHGLGRLHHDLAVVL